MTSLVFTCLLGLATPLAPQDTSPPPPPAIQQPQPAPPQQGQQGQPGQGQTPQGRAAQQGQTPQGRGARGGTPAPPSSVTPEAPNVAKPSPAVHYDSPSLQNIRVEVNLMDSLPTEGPSKKTVTMMVVDNNSGQIRSQGPGNYVLNVDAAPHLRPDGRIYLSLTLFYVPQPAGQPAQTPTPANLNEAVSVILADGKPMVISQSADPRGDRKVTVEVTATVVK